MPDHRLFQDNDQKHTSRRAQKFYDEKKITWWKTPLGSPDANVIENLWHQYHKLASCELYRTSLSSFILESVACDGKLYNH